MTRSISFANLDIPSHLNKLIPFVSMIKLVQSYEDKNLRDYIISSIIPLENFQRKISNRKLSTDINKRDLLLLELLRWFKEEFFTWFDKPNCDRCQISMNFLEYTQPTREEREIGHANRVELYRYRIFFSLYSHKSFFSKDVQIVHLNIVFLVIMLH
jgi:hypothetical protein